MLYEVITEVWKRPPEDFLANHETLFTTVHPEDRGELKRRILALRDHNEDMNLEYRIHWPDGEERWLHARGFRIETDSGPRLIGFVVDVTERKRAELALRHSEERYRLLFENMTSGFALHEMIP